MGIPFITRYGVSSAPELGRIQGGSFRSQVGIQAVTLLSFVNWPSYLTALSQVLHPGA